MILQSFSRLALLLLSRLILSKLVLCCVPEVLINIVAVVLGIVIIYGMGNAVFVFGAPFPHARALIPECVEFR